jgi:hypothetical protein
MNKRLLFAIAVLLISVNSLAQKQPGYFSIRGGTAFVNDVPKVTGNISFGVSPNRTIGIGAGIGVVDLEKTYIPLTVDISYFGKPSKASPIVVGSVGYGLYKNDSPYFTEKGGFTGSLNAGIALPTKISKFFIMGGYSIYSFTGGRNIQTSGYSYKAKDNIKVFTLTLGVKV